MSSRVLAEFLVYKQRTDFVAILYDLSAPNIHRREALGIQLDARNIRWMSSTFGEDRELQQSHSVLEAMKKIKKSGHRTIVICQSDPYYSYQLIADAAEELEMNRGKHFYLWFDEHEPSIANGGNTNISKLTDGSAWIIPPPMSYVDSNDPFSTTWTDQDEDLVAELNSLNPIAPGSPGYVSASPDYYQGVHPEFGSGLLQC